MACTSAGSWWRRVGRGAARDAGRLVLAFAGVVIILAQVFVPAVAAVDTPALALGVAVLVFGVVLPSAAEAEIGPHGLKYKATVRDRDAAVDVAFPEAEIASLAWFAAHLVGDEGRGRDLVEDALARTYADWHLVDAHERRFSVLCMLVRLALGRGALGLLQQPVPPAGTTAALAALHPRDRALLLLRHYADLDGEQIAAVMDRSLEELRADLAVAEAALDAALQGPAVEPT